MSPPIDQLLATLGGVDLADIGRLPPTLVEEAIDSLRLPLAERARLHLTLPSPAKEGDLGAYFLRQEERTRDPWRVYLERELALSRSAALATDKELERSFVDAARTQLISPSDAFSANYVLFGNADAQRRRIDMKCWFYQIGLNHEVQDFFGILQQTGVTTFSRGFPWVGPWLQE